MAAKDKPEETTGKKKGLLGGSKVPLDAVLLVVAPFVTFVMLFMYVMGLLPPRPMTVNVVGAAPIEQAPTQATVAPGGTGYASPVKATGDLVSEAEAAEGHVVVNAVQPNRNDSTTVNAGETMLPEHAIDEQVAEAGAPDQDQQLVGGGQSSQERMKRIKQLAKVYEQMNATSVAAIVANMSDDDAVEILSNMKPRSAAKVLASLEPEEAAKLSLRLTE